MAHPAEIDLASASRLATASSLARRSRGARRHGLRRWAGLGHAAVVIMGGVLASPVFALTTGCHAYAQQLAAMVAVDQALRAHWNEEEPSASGELPRIVELTVIVDRQNTERLKGWIQRCGWPTNSVQGPEAAKNAWLLSQHADHDRPFQRRVLALMGKAVARGEADGGRLAYLSDRVSVADTGIQLYGTQLRSAGPCELAFEPLDDRARVEVRRKAVGLPPLEEYRRALQDHALPEHCRTKPPAP